MTKDEIKKAWFICCTSKDDCSGCPILELERKNGHKCKYNVFKGALDLIIEQEKEIERLRTTLGQCNTELNSALESLKSQCREIGKLKAEVKQAQIDVLNKLKERAIGYTFLGEKLATETDIDELIKEVQNDAEI